MTPLAAIGWKVVPEISLGPLDISPHGIGIAVGFALGGMLLAKRAERDLGISREHTWNMLMWAVVGVIVGARLFYVVGHIGDYIPDDPLGIFRIREGGIVFYGGVFGGIAAAYPYIRKHRLPFLDLLDTAAPGFPLGLVVGRIGDLAIGDHLGEPTTMPWGFEYRGGIGCDPLDCLPDRTLPIGAVVHQTALYDFVNALVLLFVVLALSRRARPRGWLIMFTATWYGGARLLTDFARDADTYLGLSGTQWVSAALILGGGGFLIRRARAGVPAAAADEPATGNGPTGDAPAGHEPTGQDAAAEPGEAP